MKQNGSKDTPTHIGNNRRVIANQLTFSLLVSKCILWRHFELNPCRTSVGVVLSPGAYQIPARSWAKVLVVVVGGRRSRTRTRTLLHFPLIVARCQALIKMKLTSSTSVSCSVKSRIELCSFWKMGLPLGFILFLHLLASFVFAVHSMLSVSGMRTRLIYFLLLKKSNLRT